MSRARNLPDTVDAGPSDPAEGNAYFVSIDIENVRCFGHAQRLSLSDSQGAPSRWTLVLGENGVGKTTLLQLLAWGAPRAYDIRGGEQRRFSFMPHLGPGIVKNFGLLRKGQRKMRVAYDICWAQSLAADADRLHDESEVTGSSGTGISGTGTSDAYHERKGSIVYAYGANRRRAPHGLTPEASSHPTATLFDDDATLRNPEEWLLQNELVANAESALKPQAQRQRDRVLDILTRLLPDIDELRVTPRATGNQIRATVEVHGPDGWIPFSALGLGYRTMTAWIVDLASRLFERYGELADPLTGPAVCLIDEIDLHLHPRWQRDLIPRLSSLFPNTQFVATAHSPLIVQAAPDASVVVLRREPNGVIIDTAPRSVRQWRVDQILTSELFNLPSARPPELDAQLAERDRLLAKPTLTTHENARLVELRTELASLPYGDTPEDIEAMDVIRQAAQALKSAKAP